MERNSNPRPNTTRLRKALLEKYENTCQSCGITGVPLELAQITPIGTGGGQDIDDFTILCPNCHRLLDTFQPREIEFNIFLRDILTANPNYDDVVVEQALGDKLRERADLTAKRQTTGDSQSVLIESKSRSFFRRNQIERAIAQIDHYRSLSKFDAAALAFPGRISGEDRTRLEDAKIEIWDLDFIASTFAKEIRGLPPSGFTQLFCLVGDSDALSPSDELLRRLSECTPGRDDWVEYQKLIRDIFEFLFTPPLGAPIWESSDSSKANRRDIIFPNYTSDGFWKFLRESYSADFIIVDPKNYKNKVKKAQVLQIANYLKPHGAGMFAIIACRKGGDSGCVTTLREQWAAYRKLIILLTDDDIEAMLLASGSHGKAEGVIGQVIQEFRLSM